MSRPARQETSAVRSPRAQSGHVSCVELFQWQPELAVPDETHGIEGFVLMQRQEHGGRGQQVVRRDTHAAGVRRDQAGHRVRVVDQAKSCLSFPSRLRDLVVQDVVPGVARRTAHARRPQQSRFVRTGKSRSTETCCASQCGSRHRHVLSGSQGLNRACSLAFAVEFANSAPTWNVMGRREMLDRRPATEQSRWEGGNAEGVPTSPRRARRGWEGPRKLIFTLAGPIAESRCVTPKPARR